MSDLRVKGPTFDQGITGISFLVKGRVDSHLPDSHALEPPSEGIRSYLSELLDSPNIDRFVLDSLRPSINPNLSKPGAFTTAIKRASLAMARSMERDPDNAAIYRRVHRILESDIALREQVKAHYAALYQG